MSWSLESDLQNVERDVADLFGDMDNVFMKIEQLAQRVHVLEQDNLSLQNDIRELLSIQIPQK